ncbi:MAG: hypothetical protein Q7R67_02140 [bacterium]|nr:hypothetical protein [bacterium]
MIVRVSPVRENGTKNDQFLGRLAQAEAENRVADRELVNAMLRRGRSRHTPRRRSLDEQDGNWN